MSVLRCKIITDADGTKQFLPLAIEEETKAMLVKDNKPVFSISPSGDKNDLRTKPPFISILPCPYCGTDNDRKHDPLAHVDNKFGSTKTSDGLKINVIQTDARTAGEVLRNPPKFLPPKVEALEANIEKPNDIPPLPPINVASLDTNVEKTYNRDTDKPYRLARLMHTVLSCVALIGIAVSWFIDYRGIAISVSAMITLANIILVALIDK